jgi:hypothetical protein
VLIETTYSLTCLDGYYCTIFKKCAAIVENTTTTVIFETTDVNQNAAATTADEIYLCYKYNPFFDIVFVKLPIFYALIQLIKQVCYYVFSASCRLLKFMLEHANVSCCFSSWYRFALFLVLFALPLFWSTFLLIE